MKPDYKKYEDILKEYGYPLHSEEELLEIVRNIKFFAKLICRLESKPRRRKALNNNALKPVQKSGVF